MATTEARTGIEGQVRLKLTELRIEPSLRDRGIDVDHVRTLAGLDGQWPPILVSKDDNRVIDGLHRCHAAKALGSLEISCVYFTRGRDDEYLEFVKRNTAHGLPLTLKERERAALSILRSHDNWSDRRIADPCGISPGTVARLRSQIQLDASTESSAPAYGRVGKDGRTRPLDASATRDRIAFALQQSPHASLRSIAAIAGASPETVRNVRAELDRDTAIVPAGSTDATVSQITAVTYSATPTRAEQKWSADSALKSTPQGRQFVTWFAHNTVNDEWRNHTTNIPLSRVYEIADEARRRAAAWTSFADTLQARITTTHGRGAYAAS